MRLLPPKARDLASNFSPRPLYGIRVLPTFRINKVPTAVDSKVLVWAKVWQVSVGLPAVADDGSTRSNLLNIKTSFTKYSFVYLAIYHNCIIQVRILVKKLNTFKI